MSLARTSMVSGVFSVASTASSTAWRAPPEAEPPPPPEPPEAELGGGLTIRVAMAVMRLLRLALDASP